jgi:DNA-binding transcriptional regulator LsrR (DeoR family)
MTREVPYKLLQKAGRKGWLQFRPPPPESYRGSLRDRFEYLQELKVVHSVALTDVARETARELLRMAHPWAGKRLHIGFAGGHSMRELARALADELCEPRRNLPKQICFHALADGFDPGDPTTNPNGFFNYFVREDIADVEIEFHGLSAPAIVPSDTSPVLQKVDDIKRAMDAVKYIDIFVTSGASWHDPHGALRKRMEDSKGSFDVLGKAGCVGDILWRPLSRSGPITTPTSLRAMTLVDLSALPALIKEGKRVLLMLSPCGLCHRPKGDLLDCVLNLEEPLITDLVVDSRSARQMLARDGDAGVGGAAGE